MKEKDRIELVKLEKLALLESMSDALIAGDDSAFEERLKVFAVKYFPDLAYKIRGWV